MWFWVVDLSNVVLHFTFIVRYNYVSGVHILLNILFSSYL